jgi:hypothetical protein
MDLTAVAPIAPSRLRLRWPFKSRLLTRVKIILLRGLAQRVRDSGAAPVTLAVVIGIAVGTATCLLQRLLALFHWILFNTPLTGHLSAGDTDGVIRVIAVTILGCFL